MKSNEEIILHLIKQDVLYHRMIYGLQEYEVHIEFYPDFVSAILVLMGIHKEAEIEQLTNLYTATLGEVREAVNAAPSKPDQLVQKCFQILRGKY